MSQKASTRDTRPVAQVIAAEGVARAIGLKHVASLLYTYRCDLACKHCLFQCGPQQPDRRVSHEDGLEFLRQLHQTGRVIHIAGGEALLYFDSVLALCRAADQEGIAPHFIESNARWCVSDELGIERFQALRGAGVQGMLFSADPYHQVFFPPENRARAFRLAVDIFGRPNVIASDASIEKLREMNDIGRDRERLAHFTRQHPPRLVGRAGEQLAHFFPDRPLSDLAQDPLWHGSNHTADCASEFDPERMWEIHIDPYGNIQTCCGIVLGNARETPLPALMATEFWGRSEIVRRVSERGPYGLLDLATERGYRARAGYPQKCHLCWEVRKFLRPSYPAVFGPAEVYGSRMPL
ncbi:MAG: radical SAM protein [Planctomycetes bacterium]|nr:radical SAM protein [Planctomycetota bacterium]